jgi:hypothetical protein
MLRTPDVDGDQTVGEVSKPAMEVRPHAGILPAFVPAAQMLGWLIGRLAHLHHPACRQ